ncbi:MAG: hypothetical protein IPJ41_01260 [Phycisphaerales bacterium]|nr:hypothetical protein [Phycisphaerales bacterium]
MDRRAGAGVLAWSSCLRLAGLVALFLAGQLGYAWIRFRRYWSGREAALRADFAAGRVEEYHLEATNAMGARGGDGAWLLIRLRGGPVLRLTESGQRSLGVEALARELRLVVLPHSKWALGLSCSGTPIPISSRTDLRCRAWTAQCTDPVAWFGGVEEVVRRRRGAAPPFAATGESHPPA